MEKKWLIPTPPGEESLHVAEEFCAAFKIPKLVADLLYRKGLRTVSEVQYFFSPSLQGLADPFLFPDMEKAVTRIITAIDNGERITIYGDYDVDGTTATALLYLGLKRLGAIIDFYIPHRMIDGYGLSLGSLDALRESGSSLIISVDCGVNALEEIIAINAMGMEIIITDHHNPKDELPPAYAIINPKLPGCPYPFEHLAGVGVAYKLLHGRICQKGSG